MLNRIDYSNNNSSRNENSYHEDNDQSKENQLDLIYFATNVQSKLTIDLTTIVTSGPSYLLL